MVETKDLQVGEVLQAGAVEVGQLVEGDVQGPEGGRERCQELMDSCQAKVQIYGMCKMECIQDLSAFFREESPGKEFLR